LLEQGLYKGKYNDQEEPQYSKSYLDFEENVKEKLNAVVSNNLNNVVTNLQPK
jgi:hypothetical protein